MFRPVKEGRIAFCSLLILGLFFTAMAPAQITLNDSNDFVQADQLLAGDFVLVPLAKVIDSAHFHSPSLKNAELDLQSQELALQDAKRVILKALSFNGSYAYGTNARFSSSESSSSELNNSLSVTESANYSLGLSIRVSLYDILNRKNVLNRTTLEIEKFKHNREVLLLAINELVVAAYHDCLLKKKLMDLYASDKVSASLNLQMARKQFQSGEITIAQVTDVVDSHSKSIINFESARVELRMSLFRLSQLSGMRVEDLIMNVN